MVGGGWDGEQQKSCQTRPRFSCGDGGLFYNIYNINIKQRMKKWG